MGDSPLFYIGVPGVVIVAAWAVFARILYRVIRDVYGLAQRVAYLEGKGDAPPPPEDP